MLLDYQLPDQNGLQILESLKNDNYKIPFIMMTACGDEKVAVEAMKYGAMEYVIKDSALQERLPDLISQSIQKIYANQILEDIELKYQESNERTQLIIDTAADAFISVSMDGIIMEWNREAENVFGWMREEVLGSIMINELIPENTRSEINKITESIINEDIDIEKLNNRCFHTKLKCRSGKEIPVEVSSTIIKSHGIWVTNAFVRDISNRKKMESRLVQSEKMASLGQLAAGVAHEINNPIGFVSSNVKTLSEYIDVFKLLLEKYQSYSDCVNQGDQELQNKLIKEINELREQEDIESIIEDTSDLLKESDDGLIRVKDIVLNLKSFVRLDETGSIEANINECIEATLKIVWNELKYNCEIVKEYGELPMLQCVPGQLNQVFMNLLVNASHSIKENGIITIQTEATSSEIIIRIIDTGEGIPEENLKELFTPFFTTKPVGQGTGLGLSISYGIVEKHNGRIDVESKVGKGSCFTIHLPLNNSNE